MPDTSKRDKRLNIPVREEEKEQVKEDARSAGYMSMSDYVRDVLLGEDQPKAKVPA